MTGLERTQHPLHSLSDAIRAQQVIQALPEKTIPGDFSREQLRTLLAQLWQVHSKHIAKNNSASTVASSDRPSHSSSVISSQQAGPGRCGNASKTVQDDHHSSGTGAEGHQGEWGLFKAAKQQPQLWVTNGNGTLPEGSNVQQPQAAGHARMESSDQQNRAFEAIDVALNSSLKHHQLCQNKLTTDADNLSNSDQLLSLQWATKLQHTSVPAPADQCAPSSVAALVPGINDRQLPGSNSILQRPHQCLLQEAQVVKQLNDSFESSSSSSASTCQPTAISCTAAKPPSDADSSATAAQGTTGCKTLDIINSSNSAACDDDSDECLTLELNYLQPQVNGRDVDLNTASDYELRLAKVVAGPTLSSSNQLE